VAQIEQQREISDDMNVLAGGREISGFYTEYWSIVEDPVFDGRRKGFQNCSSGGREKAVFSVSLQPTLLSTPLRGALFSIPLRGIHLPPYSRSSTAFSTISKSS
jgi:hypothetical protein